MTDLARTSSSTAAPRTGSALVTSVDHFAHIVKTLQRTLRSDKTPQQKLSAITELLPAMIDSGKQMRTLKKERDIFMRTAADALRKREHTALQSQTIYTSQAQTIAMLQVQLAEAINAYKELKRGIAETEEFLTTINQTT